LKYDDIPKLSELYKNKYNRELIGKKLGQFHSDFPSMDGSDSFSIKSIAAPFLRFLWLEKVNKQNETSRGLMNFCPNKGI
jgi:hypothetical protein